MQLVDLGRRAAGAILAYALVVAVVKAGLIAAGLVNVASEIPGGAPLDKLFLMAEESAGAVQQLNGTTLSPYSTISSTIAAVKLGVIALAIMLYIAFIVIFGYVEIALWLVTHVPPQYAYLAAMVSAGLAILQVAVMRWFIYTVTGR